MNASSGTQWMEQLEMMESLEYDHASLSSESLSSESLSSCTTEDHDLFGKPYDRFLGSSTHNPQFFTLNGPAKMAMMAPNNIQGSSPSSSEHPQFILFRDLSASSPQVIDSELRPILKQPRLEIADHEPTINQANNFTINTGKKKRTRSMALTPNLLSPDHILAERRRRQKLNQRFIALSALIPGLKKMDKASVLGEAVKYLKHLKERVKTLEEQLKQRNAESVVVVKKSHLSMEDDHFDDVNDTNSTLTNSSNRIENSKLQTQEAVFPEIEARVMDKEVFLIIHCQKQQGLLGRILNEMDKLHLTVTIANSMPFGNYDLIITITAEMEANFCETAKDIISKLKTVV